MKNIEKMKVVRDAIKTLLAELGRVRKLKKESSDDFEQVVRHGDFEDEKHLKRFADATFKKSIAPAKEAAILKRLSAYEGIWPEVWHAARHQWDKLVADKQEAEFQRYLVAIRPWFGGEAEERLTRRTMEAVHISAIAEYRRHFSPDFSRVAATVEDFVEWVNFFEAHIQRVLAKTGWTLPQLKIDPKDLEIRPETSVKVKALCDCTVDLPAPLDQHVLAPRGTAAAVGRRFKKDEVGEISASQYAALARNFEKLS